MTTTEHNQRFDLFYRLLWTSTMLGRYRDTAPRGNGNRAARRAIQTSAGKEHAFWVDEPVYSPGSAAARVFDRGLRLITHRPLKP